MGIIEEIYPEYKPLLNVMKTIRSLTERDGLKVLTDFEKNPSITDSKYGGYPYWDVNQPYPHSSDGKPLILLAQFNLAQLPVFTGLPRSGMLQFFLSDDKKEAKVVFHNRIDGGFTKEKAEKMNLPTSIKKYKTGDYFPVKGTIALDVEINRTQLGSGDADYEKLLNKIVKKAGYEKYLADERSFYDILNELGARNDPGILYYDKGAQGTWLLGYPSFFQPDTRTDEERKKYNVLLFQSDSLLKNPNKENTVMWGDMGTGYFFINYEKFINRDFSDILYFYHTC